MKIIAATQLALICIVCLVPVVNTEDRFTGDWHGKVALAESEKERRVRVVIQNNKAASYYCKDGKWTESKVGPNPLVVHGNNALMTWINEGGIWTETQVFSFSLVNHRTLALTWARHVNNIKEAGDNQTWQAFGHGTLTKGTDSDGICD